MCINLSEKNNTECIFVSIIVPVFNVEKYIVRCFNSVAKQSYTNIECIFIDDGSSDKSIELLNELIDEYAGNISFSLVQHEKNKGVSEARNTGIQTSKGEYIYFLDSDDEITETCIQSLVALEKQYKNVDMVMGNTVKIPQENSSNQYDIKNMNFPKFTDNQLWLKKHFFSYHRIPGNIWNKLIRKKYIVDHSLYFPNEIIQGEDTYWAFFAAKKIKSMAFTEEYTYVHYITPGSIMASTANNYNKIYSQLIALEDMIENIDMEIANEQKKYLVIKLRGNIYRISKQDQNLLPRYRRVIKIMRRDAYLSLNIFRYIGLLLLSLPYPLLNNFFIKKISGMLIWL
jgi:glycosyltransferase involved in cell wall biosynthesis